MNKDIERKIAIIFVTDVVSFSKMMEKNEDETLRSFRLCRDILDNLFQEYGGRVFNTAGDSVLAEFQSAVSAVVCAKEFQKLIRQRNLNVEEDSQMTFRVGLNMGDVIVEGDNLYGDGVNVAARLEALSQHGGVCLSKSIMDFVNKKTDLEFYDLGEQQVKNTNVHAFDIADSDLEKRKLDSSKDIEEEPAKAPTIAVLPFTNLSNDPDQDYFADGITEDIISHLSQWKTFPVISSNSVFSYKNTKETSKTIAKELGARYLVFGSVRKGGNKVRINTKLINAEDDTQIWSQNWDRSLEDIFEIQDEVSQKVAVIISPALKASELKRLSKKKVRNLSSWEEYLQGQALYIKSINTKGIDLKTQIETKKSSLEKLNKAISMDENFAEPHIIISRCMIDFVFEPTLSSERTENEKKLNHHSDKAYELDPNNPDAIISKGITFWLKGDFERLKETFEKALDINPNHPRSLQMYSMQLLRTGEYDKSIEYIKKMWEVDPISRHNSEGFLVFNYISKKDYDNALITLSRLIEDTPHNRYIGFKASVLALKGEIDESKIWLKKYLDERKEIKNIPDYLKVVPDMNDDLKNNLVEGMKLAGLPE